MPPKEHDNTYQFPRVSMDLKVPLWGVMGVVGTGALIAAFMYFQLARIAEDVIELKATLKASNAQTIELAREQAITKFRVDKLESSR